MLADGHHVEAAAAADVEATGAADVDAGAKGVANAQPMDLVLRLLRLVGGAHERTRRLTHVPALELAALAAAVFRFPLLCQLSAALDAQVAVAHHRGGALVARRVID